MAYKNALDCITLEAGQDLSAKQFFFMTVASDGQVDPTGDGGVAVGVLQNDPAAGGVTKVSVGASITAGANVASDAAGEAVPAASGDAILGVALAAGDDGDIIPMLFQPRGTL